MVHKMLEISIRKILRGGIVTIFSSFIIYFLVIILSPILPFISLNGIMPLILLIIIFLLTIITYFFLPPEIPKNKAIENSKSSLHLEN
jgi:hypothetical protein